jgi:phthalate 4,5-dioxygenase oxygenase subunit
MQAAANDYVRSTVFVAPATALIPPNNLYNVANINVPMDDTHTAFYFIAWGHESQTPDTDSWRKFLGQQVGTDLDETYVPLRNRANHYWQDRAAMKAGNFTGITGFPNQDIAMWVTMGPIADRTHERLGASDQAVVEFRKLMLDAVRDFQAGGQAIGTGDSRIPDNVCAFQAIVPKTTDWRAYAAHHVWTAKEPALEPSYSAPVPAAGATPAQRA